MIKIIIPRKRNYFVTSLNYIIENEIAETLDSTKGKNEEKNKKDQK